ncbi:hypothetical protein BH10BDE1_BH10BDE1_14840 [soil metagenome]
MVKKSRRELLIKSGIAFGGSLGLAALYQNCADPGGLVVNGQNSSASTGPAGGASPLGYVASPGITTIDGTPVKEAVTGSDLDIFVDFTLATHYSHSDLLGTHEQYLLSVIGGRNRVTPFVQKWRTNKSAESVLAVMLYDKDSGNLIRAHHFNETSYQVSVLMMIPDSYLTLTRNVSVVVHHATRGFLKRDFTMSKNLATPYSTLVAPFNPASPFAGADPTRAYVSGLGLASGGQGDLGLIHYPLIELLAEDTVRVTLGGTTARHPRVGEDHYIAGATLYDQDGHIIALTTSVPYGDVVNYSVVTFPRIAIRDRGITQLRTVVHDTYNGYLMGFLNI